MPAANQRAHPIRGYFYIAAATFCWGVSAVLGKAVFDGRLLPSAAAIGPMVLSQTRVTIAFLVLFPVLLISRGRRGLALPRRDLLGAMLIGSAGITASNFFYYVAIQKTTVAVAITLQYLSPVLVLVYMVARGRQRATPLRVGAVVLAVVGSALAIGLGQGGSLINQRINLAGVAAGLAAAFGFSYYTVGGSDLLQRNDRWIIFMYSMLGAAIFWLFVNPPWRLVTAHYSGAQWTFILAFAVVSILIGYSFYYAGLQQLDATRAIVTSCLEPVFAIVIAAVALGEGITALQGVGVAVVLAATILVQLPRDSSTPERAA